MSKNVKYVVEVADDTGQPPHPVPEESVDIADPLHEVDSVTGHPPHPVPEESVDIADPLHEVDSAKVLHEYEVVVEEVHSEHLVPTFVGPGSKVKDVGQDDPDPAPSQVYCVEDEDPQRLTCHETPNSPTKNFEHGFPTSDACVQVTTVPGSEDSFTIGPHEKVVVVLEATVLHVNVVEVEEDTAHPPHPVPEESVDIADPVHEEDVTGVLHEYEVTGVLHVFVVDVANV